ncbi:MAG: hypothetical protein ACHQ51_06395 [Elusimicrobiota bacterium]
MATATKNHKHSVTPVRTQLSVDYPRQNEKITGATYTFRISAPLDVQKVEVAIDQAGWRACRQSAGFWWCDWSGYENGEHEIVARLVNGNGRTVSSEPHEFFVAIDK